MSVMWNVSEAGLYKYFSKDENKRYVVIEGNVNFLT